MTKTNDEQKKLIILIGLPGSGKSTFAKKRYNNYRYVNSDEIRYELTNTYSDTKNHDLVFDRVRKEVKINLLNNDNIILDATNLHRKYRRRYIEMGHKYNYKVIAEFMLTPLKTCLKQNSKRKQDRRVPNYVIHEMYKKIDIPVVEEKWDDVHVNYPNNFNSDDYDIDVLLSQLDKFDQQSKHHKLSLGEHLRLTNKFIQQNQKSQDIVLYYASVLHDIGKPYVKKMDGKFAHYYNHENVSAYMSLFYLYDLRDTYQHLAIANLIYYHMRPYQSTRKLEKKIPDLIYNYLMKLHEADKKAH